MVTKGQLEGPCGDGVALELDCGRGPTDLQM